MFQRLILLMLLACFTLVALPGDVMADRKRLKKPSEKRDSKPATISESRHLLTGCITAGMLIGDITKYIQEDAGKVPYGVGLGYEYYLRPNFGIGAEVRFLWLSSPVDYIEDAKSSEFRLYGIYRMRPMSRKTIFLKFGVGPSSGSAVTSGNKIKVTRTQLRAALGLLSYSSGRLNTRLEFSYNRLLHKAGENIFLGLNYPRDVDYLALDIGLGLPL